MNTKIGVAKQRYQVVILLGPPGAGKGTQCKRLAEAINLPPISTGDLLRDNVYRSTELGRKVQDILKRGVLVPDDMMLDMLGARIVQQDCSAGFILDGLPRNHEQAQLLDAHLSKVIDPSKLLTLSVARLTLNQSLLIRRISGRQTCPACALVYNIHTRPPRIKDTCDFDGSRLALRNDDREETVIERLRIYEHEVLSIVHHYAEQGNVVEIDGDRNVEQVTHDILATICESPLTELLLDAVLEGSD